MALSLICIADLAARELQELVASLGEPGYRAKQLQRWVYRRLAVSFDEMTDLPQGFRQGLAAGARVHGITAVHEVTGSDSTIKTLFALADGKTIEAALMRYPGAGGRARHTVCVSTQVGCPIGCPFCATGQQGFERNLSAGEIVDQVLYFARRLRDQSDGGAVRADGTTGHISNIVFMGMGEPLANYEALRRAMEALNSPEGFGLAARSMTISTAGLVPQIQLLSKENLQVGLTVSLHASNNALRDRLVPVNRGYPLEELIPACRQYGELTGRRISFEYVLLDGVNDSLVQARALAHLVAGLNCHVNLIRANPGASQAFRPSPEQAVLAFQGELTRLRINSTLRQPRGQGIDAGCGQLRSRFRAGAGNVSVAVKTAGVAREGEKPKRL